MLDRLKFLTVEDFRSIRGPVAVSLDAPVVLIHGPNGTGKTSLLAAIELGLTSAVPSLARVDDEYLAHLPHKLSIDGRARIGLQAHIGESLEAKLVADGRSIVGNGLLDRDNARFYTERCYLAQATLGRLLEIYEHQDNRKTDSPLTKFVKEMLGLEALDELIEGLHAAGDVRRFRESAPLFWSARADAPKLDDSVTQAQELVQTLSDEAGRLEAKLHELTGSLIAVENPIEPAVVRPVLTDLVNTSETRLVALARVRRDISGASNQLREMSASDAESERIRAEQASVAAREALSSWRSGLGRDLEVLIETIRETFPDVPLALSDPAASHLAAMQAIRAAVARNQALAAADDIAAQQLTEVGVAIRQGQARIDQIDGELANNQGASNELAEALTAISGHIHDERCPVCDRDYSEVSSTPLASHVSEVVARLVTAAGRVEALVRDRTATVGSVAAARRREGDIQSKRLSRERRDHLKSELATLTEWANALRVLFDVAASGSQLIREATQTAQSVSILNSRESSISGLRAELANYAAQLYLAPWSEDVPLMTIIDSLTVEVERRTEEETGRKAAGEQGLETLVTLTDVRKRFREAKKQHSQLKKQQVLSATRRTESERRISIARDLVGRAQAFRNDEVRRVFNEELNAVWRELFIRLAPDEAFVPAFALPEVAGRPVEAVLETLYRSGGKGGNPRAMLSAGNLNTAALTLFLALHLSVPPELPWLVIDDPVQSMDDVHIAQFAALLRTLKQHGRQVIIAVHERQLFDYLALELSPAFNGDRLVTIELGRGSDGMTTAPWNLTSFEPDKAIAA